MYLLLVQWTQFKFSYISKTLTRDVLKVIFFPFFLYINRFLTIECLLKKCIIEELSCGSFLQTIIVNRGNSSKLSQEKPFYFCVNELICIRFQKFSIRAKVDQNFFFFLLLRANESCLNCLAMVNAIISLFPSFVFWKQLIYLFIVLNY